MALTLNGTTGLSGIVGSAGTPALQGSDTNTGYFFGTDTLGLSTGGSERLRITSTGDIGINCTPHSNAGINLQIHGDNTTSEIRLTNTTTGSGNNGGTLQMGGNTLYISNSENGNIVFENNGSERLRIDSSGNLLVKTTTQNTHVGLKADSTAINFTLGSTSGSSPRMYFYGTGNGQSSAGDIFTGTGSGGILHFRSAELIKFEVNSDNSTAEALSIGADKNVTITDGDLVIGTAGHGIDFSATTNGTGSAQNELLDDYEEGTWVPVYQSAAGSITVGGYASQVGRYVKIGRLVYIEGLLKTSSITNNSSGTYDIGGLPFTGNSAASIGAVKCYLQSAWSKAPDSFDLVAGTNAMRARQGIDVGDGSYTQGDTNDFNTNAGDKNRIYFSGHYRV